MSRTSYQYRATFIHEVSSDDEVTASTILTRSRSAPIEPRVVVDENLDEGRRSYTEKLAENVAESFGDSPKAASICERWCDEIPYAAPHMTVTDGCLPLRDDHFQREPAFEAPPAAFPLRTIPSTFAQVQHSDIATRWHDFTPGIEWSTANWEPQTCAADQRRHQFSPSAGGFNSRTDIDKHMTTFMVRNIPCRVTKQQLKSALEALGLDGAYDFLHLPMTESGVSNLGYFFINFVSPGVANEKVGVFEGYRFPNTNSPKVCTVRPARLQGFTANIKQFGGETRGKNHIDVDTTFNSNKKTFGSMALTESRENAIVQNGDVAVPASFRPFRQVTETSTAAGTDAFDSSGEDDAEWGIPKTAAAGQLSELPKAAPPAAKVKRSRPPKFIRERMKRKNRTDTPEAFDGQAATMPFSSDGVAAPPLYYPYVSTMPCLPPR